MAVRFKFRSSSSIDSIDLSGHPSISVRELRSKILDSSKLRFSRGFDLLISDAGTNKPFEDEEFQIPAGADVIIKRVPTGASVPSQMENSKGVAAPNPNASPSENINLDNFEDFGNEVYPTFDSVLKESEPDVTNLVNKDSADPRRSEISTSRHHYNDGSDLSEAISKEIVGENCKDASDVDEDNSNTEIKTKAKSEECKKSSEGVSKCNPVMFNTDLPTELRCLLCNTIFKDAVMIPCCQHSFCDKCIRSALVDKRKCPKCSSTKCLVDDLLPNLSLRQAIERFIEAQASIGGLDNNLPKDAPDGESGIQARETSCAVSIRQQDWQALPSPSATGKGSNRITTESTNENKRSNAGIKIRLDDRSIKAAALPSSGKTEPVNIDKTNRDKIISPSEGMKQRIELQESGTNSKLPMYPPEQAVEGNMPFPKRKEFSFNTQDGAGSFVPQMKFRKGDKTCYMCGSPSHFIRDCPVANNNRFSGMQGDAGFNGGMSAYGSLVDWTGPVFPQYRPYSNMYGNPGVVPFDTGVYPLAPFSVPSCVPSLYPSMTNPYGFMGMGGMPPNMSAGGERPLFRPEFMDPRASWQRNNKSLSEHAERELNYDNRSDDYYYNETQRKQPKQSYESDSEPRDPSSEEEYHRTYKNQSKKPAYYNNNNYSSDDETETRYRRSHHSDKSISESSDRYSGRHRKSSHLQRSRKQHEESTLESEPKKRELTQSKKGGMSSKDQNLNSDRWEMVDGSDDDNYRREYHRHHHRHNRHRRDR